MSEIRIHTERGESHDRPALGTLSELVGRIGADGDHFVIAERLTDPDAYYIQVWHDAGDDYQLEYRDGSAERHFQAFLPTAAEVVAVMERWARQEKGWDAGPAWERLDFPSDPAPDDTPALDPEVERELAEAVRGWLRCGYDGRDALTESAEEYLVRGDVRPVSREQAARLVDRLWRERLAEQADWTGTTDPERITRAFAALEASGITAREDFTCCRNCGLGEIRGDGAQDARGFVFFHRQAAEGAAAGHDLFLMYGGFEPGESLTVSVGREVVAALDAEGLGWTWGGAAHDAIRVTGLDWRKRLTG
ncbi:DUF6891 domain-containing protein [Streptomyces sp. TN58]|uniref:DUF6891 domain-containing protein n=1 Tax=Streptomyces sp. TN58 TaxID=234612 RepID=UPI000950B421|nr:hypothetical protein [Streptomyces sp. TN58]APU40014.1 hypothetical protein BSL84_09745 [Streptomyces sp. TN58]